MMMGGGMLFLSLLFLLFLVLLLGAPLLLLAGFGYLLVRERGKGRPGEEALGRACASCGRSLNSDWTHCPYCGAEREA